MSSAQNKVRENHLAGNFGEAFQWLLVSLVPFVILMSMYFLMPWSWGLMDDFQTLEAPGGIGQRTVALFQGYCQFGLFRPTLALYAGIFYKIFEHHPQWFYVFKATLGYLVLFLWGWQAYRLTRHHLAFVLVPAITLSFHYFYDAFFYLSSQEILGMFFTGAALHFFINTIPKTQSEHIKKSWLNWFLMIFCLAFAFGAKEPFVTCGVAIGVAYFLVALKNHSKTLFLQGGLVILFAFGYAFLLKLIIQGGYTTHYDVMNFASMRSNLFVWAKKDLLNHLPWLLAWAFLIFRKFSANIKHIADYYKQFFLGIGLGIIFYLGYLLILLPWNTTSYYAGPLGLFFAFTLAILIADLLHDCSKNIHAYILLGGLILNIVVCQYALMRETTYQYDTQNLMAWLHSNADQFEQDRVRIYSNAMEPAMAIPGHMKRNRDSKIQSFTHSYDAQVISTDPYAYYLFSSRFGSLDQNLNKNYKIKFLSKNWVLYGH